MEVTRRRNMSSGESEDRITAEVSEDEALLGDIEDSDGERRHRKSPRSGESRDWYSYRNSVMVDPFT